MKAMFPTKWRRLAIIPLFLWKYTNVFYISNCYFSTISLNKTQLIYIHLFLLQLTFLIDAGLMKQLPSIAITLLCNAVIPFLSSFEIISFCLHKVLLITLPFNSSSILSTWTILNQENDCLEHAMLIKILHYIYIELGFKWWVW